MKISSASINDRTDLAAFVSSSFFFISYKYSNKQVDWILSRNEYIFRKCKMKNK